MFNKKLKQQREKAHSERMTALQLEVDAALAVSDPGKRYDALGALLAVITTRREENNKIRNNGDLAALSLISSAIPAGIGAGFVLKSLAIADIAITGGILTGCSIGVIGAYQGYKFDAAQKQKHLIADDYNFFMKKIFRHRQSILEDTDPEQLLSSDNATRQLRNDPGIKNKFLEAARLKKPDDAINSPSVGNKSPGFDI